MFKNKCGCAMMWMVKILLIVGGLNWGLVGLGMLVGQNLNAVAMLSEKWPLAEAVVYLLIGIAAAGKLLGCRCAKCKTCWQVAGAGATPAGQNQM